MGPDYSANNTAGVLSGVSCYCEGQSFLRDNIAAWWQDIQFLVPCTHTAAYSRGGQQEGREGEIDSGV